MFRITFKLDIEIFECYTVYPLLTSQNTLFSCLFCKLAQLQIGLLHLSYSTLVTRDSNSKWKTKSAKLSLNVI